MLHMYCTVFFFNDTATTEIYTLSLHDALPIWVRVCDDEQVELLEPLLRLRHPRDGVAVVAEHHHRLEGVALLDRKSTRLNSSHANISYAVFCLKKKNINNL